MWSNKVVAQEEHDEVYFLIMAGWASQVVRTLAALSIAEHLGNGALTAPQIAERATSDPDMTYRVLRAGAALGFLTYDPETTLFTPTSKLEILRADSPYSLKHYAQTTPGPAFWLPALRSPDTVRRGKNFVEEMLGSDVWEFFAQHDDEARIFRAAMTDISAPVIRDAVSNMGQLAGDLVVDVGGANGTFVGELLQRNPTLRGVVLDLPQAMPGVAEMARSLALSDRMSGVAGNFLESVPAADIYLLKHVLHDWDDYYCGKILSNIRHSMKPDARLYIVEMVIADPADPATSMTAVLMDIAMLHAFSGRERDMVEFEKLLSKAGLTVAATTPLHRPYQLIEVRSS